MDDFREFAHRFYLKCFRGRANWHQRHYRESVHVLSTPERIVFEENGLVVETLPLSALRGQMSGRWNLLLSGPSVREIENIERIAKHSWIGVNGSPTIFGEQIPEMSLYHVNDTAFIRNSLERFLSYASRAEYTVIDYRSMYTLLEMTPENLPETKLVIYDAWSYPHRLPRGKIEQLVDAPENNGIFLSTNLDYGLSVGGTVAYTAGQICWLSGCEELYYYGLDLTNSGRSYKESSALPQMLDKAYEIAILPGFRLLAAEASKTGMRLYNANPKSRLPGSVIPHVDPKQSLLDG